MNVDQYLEVFIDEAQEHLQTINEKLLELEQQPDQIHIVQDIFRSAHTLKGMAATMGFEDLSALTHQMENVLDLIRHGQLDVYTDMIDVLFEAVDALATMVHSIVQGGNGRHDVTHIVDELTCIESGGHEEKKGEEAPDTSVKQKVHTPLLGLNEFEQTVLEQSLEMGFKSYEIQVFVDDSCLLKAARAYMVFESLEEKGEVIKAVPPVDQIEEEQFEQSFQLVFVSQESREQLEKIIMNVSEIKQVQVREYEIASKQDAEKDKDLADENALQKKGKTGESVEERHVEKNGQKQMSNQTIRVNIERMDALMNLFSELVIDRGRLQQIASDLKDQDLTEAVEHMTHVSEDLQDLILNMRMVPVEHVFNRFPRRVRGLARDLEKDIQLSITGADTELDRTVIDEIGDPLVHLLRNSVDHGIEHPETRLSQGKPRRGTIYLSAYHSGNHVFIEIEDDGGGIDPDNILNKALEKQLITEERSQELTNEDIYQLMFTSGFSTAEKVTDVSGRGVGLDVVSNKIQSLGGHVSVKSEWGQGTTFTIQLLLTLSIISAMLVKVGNETYAVPLNSIVETAAVARNDIRTVHGQSVIDFREKVVPLISVADVFDVPTDSTMKEELYILLVHRGDQMAGLVVDTFIGQDEVVLKSLGHYLNNVPGLSGATILGDGQVALIVDSHELIP